MPAFHSHRHEYHREIKALEGGHARRTAAFVGEAARQAARGWVTASGISGRLNFHRRTTEISRKRPPYSRVRPSRLFRSPAIATMAGNDSLTLPPCTRSCNHRPRAAPLSHTRVRQATTTSRSFRQRQHCPFAAPSVATNSTRSSPWLRPRSTRWSSAANSRDASGLLPAASSGTSKRSRPGSRPASRPRVQRRSTSPLDRM